ncbi:MAG: signal transduction histidine kinase/FixJ family two-component response regulator [Thalassolituus oleivorans]|jgi:signal transduction histidine kinase/FixJ family two-component response regulator
MLHLQLGACSTMSDQQVFKARRSYNRWVANQTLEDFALRFTAKSARRWSAARVSNTALGAISFLALEAIGATVTLLYGFDNAFYAFMAVSLVIFLTAIPISYYAAKYGVDIDLLSRGAGFGYIGSTITSLIYASFTFIFFALESAIMASALDILFGLPLMFGYLLSAIIVIPLVTHGITLISRFQLWTQPIWLVLQLAPFVFILWHEWSATLTWVQFTGIERVTESAPIGSGGFNLVFFGAASAVIFSLIAQIGEQVDFLRFLPEPDKKHKLRWWTALMGAGPGWIVVGFIKLLGGSFLAVLALSHGLNVSDASDPTQIYRVAFGYLFDSPMVVMAVTGIFVILCQVKINVTNAYAGSIAWSNFFSRLTHSHPGRVVWLVFNVMIALLLMVLGVYESLVHILGIYANVAVAWVGALVADLVINKPLGLSPKHIEFKRAYLYDVNPVGCGAMILASLLGIICYVGVVGPEAQAMAPYVALLTAFVTAPIIAFVTKGRFYLAREIIPIVPVNPHSMLTECVVCENTFDLEDIAQCPAYGGHICSLCCSLEARCHDQCKEKARLGDQLQSLLETVLPVWLVQRMNPRLMQFSGFLSIIAFTVAVLFWLVYLQVPTADAVQSMVGTTLVQVYFLLLIIIGVLIWLFVLANESRQFALDESMRQTELLTQEISAHEATDRALQDAKELAEAANRAKSRYLGGISHELRSPLNSILGYAQLLEKDKGLDTSQLSKVKLVRRSGEHLADLIEGLLDISRIEAGRLEIRREEVAIRSMLQELVDMFSLQAENKGIAFYYRPSPHLPAVVTTDEKHLRQILINLLSNAVKFTHSGSVTLSVRYRSQVAEFSVEDTGVGIDSKEMERIFQPFERIRKAGQPQMPGTGLGLTISKLLTDIMGGEITLKSDPGQGSRFKLSLMLSSVSMPLQRTTQVREIDSYHGPQRTVMVVDDDASHRGLISEILSPLGFIVLEATNAFACLEAIDTVSVDLFFLDISMPEMTGWELVKELRHRNITAPIIMASADAEESHEHNQRQNGTDNVERLNDDYLIKPIRDQVLLDKLAAALALQWIYKDDVPVNEVKTADAEIIDISHADARELIAMAELGYVDGVEKILVRIESSGEHPVFVQQMKRYLASYQFATIISTNQKVLSRDQA